MTAEPRTLDWRDARHWSAREAPCVHCGGLTHLRDEDGLASHKVCAEQSRGPKEASS